MKHRVTKELFSCEIPEGQSLEWHQYRTRLRSMRNVESAAHWNHHESSTGIIDIQHPRDSDVFAHAGKVIPRQRPVEVRGATNDQGFTALLKHLFLKHGDGRGFTATLSPDPGSLPKTRIRASAGSLELTSRTAAKKSA